MAESGRRRHRLSKRMTQHITDALRRRDCLRKEDGRCSESAEGAISESCVQNDLLPSIEARLQETASPSGPGRPSTSTPSRRWFSSSSVLLLSVLVLLVLPSHSDACSSRSTPKPRPLNSGGPGGVSMSSGVRSHMSPLGSAANHGSMNGGSRRHSSSSAFLRPNITFQTYACPPAYAAWYCLNGATCFTVKIAESILYNCECADGYMGQRCEFKDLDGTYLPARERLIMLGKSRANLVFSLALLCVGVMVVVATVCTRQRNQSKMRNVNDSMDEQQQQRESDASVLRQCVSFGVDQRRMSSYQEEPPLELGPLGSRPNLMLYPQRLSYVDGHLNNNYYFCKGSSSLREQLSFSS